MKEDGNQEGNVSSEDQMEVVKRQMAGQEIVKNKKKLL